MAQAHHLGDAARGVFCRFDGHEDRKRWAWRVSMHTTGSPPCEVPGAAIPTADRPRSQRDR
jgi:hypothetical protein